MRWLKFTAAGPTSWGIIEGDRVIAVDGDPFGEWQRTPRTHALAEVKIELPLMPRTFLLRRPQLPQASQGSRPTSGARCPTFPDRPEIGYRAQNALIAHDEDVVIPATATEKIHYEGELVVVIGKKAKHLSEADAMSCVFRLHHRQRRQRTELAEGRSRAVAGEKMPTTFKPMGP